MRIGIDGRLLGHERGMGGFAASLLAAMPLIDFDAEIRVYVHRAENAVRVPFDGRFSAHAEANVPFPVWEQVTLPAVARRDRLDLLHCPSNTGPMRMPTACKLVLTIHDVMYMLPESVLPRSPSLYQRVGRTYRKAIVPRASRIASLVFADSQYSKSDITSQLPDCAAKTMVVYGAAHTAFQRIQFDAASSLLRQNYGIAGRPIVALGAIDPRKNTKRIIAAFAELSRGNAMNDTQLVIAGCDELALKLFNDVAVQHEVAGRVKLLGLIPQSDLIALYSAAQMAVYPSLYEGFGLPVLEAMACGAPVVTSNTTSLPEIAAGAAILVDPLNVDDIRAAMQQLMEDEGLRAKLVTLGLTRAAQFSWPSAAAQTVAGYKRALSA